MNQNISISNDTLYKSIKNKESFLLFDLRTKDQYDKGHILGSSHAVCNAETKKNIMSKIPKNIKIVLVDQDGSMSRGVAEMMRDMKFDSYYLEGGMKNWKWDLNKKTISDFIGPVDLWKKLNNKNEVDKIFLLDVREPEEFSDFKILGSVNISLKDLLVKENLMKIPNDKEIITICPHGNRAKIAYFMLEKNNIPSKTLYGGLANWNQVLIDTKIKNTDPLIIQVEKIGKGCLSHIIISEKEAIVIDPLFPIERYKEISEKEDFRITKVINTHQHADHLSAAYHLATMMNAIRYESKLEKWDISTNFLKDKDIVPFGQSTLKVIHTPGHTPGSLCFLVDDKYLFTGDILFIESIGRPDLRDKASEFAYDLYDSLQNKIFKLPKQIYIYPTHHGESVLPNADGIYSTTLKIASEHDILKYNKNEFVKEVVKISTPRPKNYARIIQINKGSISLNKEEIPNLELGPNRCSI
ncbi:MAG: rhodanese-like domain-containing protein [Nitrososphaeraceae archaeon]